jgi:hypothetical protein
MSAINSTSGSGLIQYLQGLTGSQSSSSSAATSTATTAGTPKAGKHHHNSGFDKLLSAVTSALQSAGGSSTSAASTDPNQTITEALTKIFKNGSVQSTPDSQTDPTSETDSTDGTDDASSPDNFLQTLKSFGVTAQQFQSDLTTALKSAQQSGSADLNAAFKSFPTGSIVDTIG